MNIDFVLSQSDGRPMYLQIIEQVTQRVIVGDWPPGTRLPSIRELAIALKVSVITVKRAYLELEREGVIMTQQGRGSWISEGLELNDLQRDELGRHLENAARVGLSMGMSSTELAKLLAEYTNTQG